MTACSGPAADPARLALAAAREDARRGRFRAARTSARPVRWRGSTEPVSVHAVLDELKPEWAEPAVLRVLAQWRALAGELAHGLAAVGFDTRTRTLALQPVAPVWAVQGRLLVPALIRAMNAHLGSGTVRTVRLLDPAPNPFPAGSGPAQPRPELRRAARAPEDPQILAAAARQARGTPREPEGSFPAARDTRAGSAQPETRRLVVRTRALLRARTRPSA
ncbi:DciA family protein [Streptomyces sp. NPDC017529]|uniref:DciA family protein n=1 Tax=Streptomyces sp. NPDC017529 TaxID=3365000 RepID=UPI0037AE71EE